MNSNHIKTEWDSLWASIDPKGKLSKVQKTEMRKAFYAGAAAVFYKLVKGVSPGGEPTDQDMKLFEDIDAELREFAASVAGN